MNSDSLIPLLLAYGEDLPDDAAAVPLDDAAAAEEALLRVMREALSGMESPTPPAETLANVLEAAHNASRESELAPLRATLAGLEDDSPEGALLRTTLHAIGRTGRPTPPADVTAGIVAAAHEAAVASDLAPLRSVLAQPPSAESDEAAEPALLRTTLAALDSLPRATPPADVVANLVSAAGAAARASDLAPVRSALGVTDAGASGAEEELLRTTWQAVQRVPRTAPPISAIQAVLSAAHAAIPGHLREAGAVRRAADRPSVREARSFRTFAYLTAALAFAGLVSVGLWASGDGRGDATSTIASLDEQPAGAPAEPEALLDESPRAAGSPSASVEELLAADAGPAVGSGAGAGAVDAARPVRENSFMQPPPPPPPPAASPLPPTPQEVAATRDERSAARITAPASAGVGLAAAADRAESPGAGLAGAPGVAPAWEAGADVRVLSLRLKAMQESTSGLAWEEPPSPLGAAETGGSPAAGFNPVGTTTAPARFQVRVGPRDSD